MARVLLVHQPIDGGVGRHLADLWRGLTTLGHEVALCGPEPLAGVPTDAHVPLELTRAVDPRRDAAALRRYGRVLRSVAPELVHAHSSKAGAIARVARGFQPRVPVVYTPHGYAFAGFFERAAERRLYRGVEQALAPLASTVLCVCEAEARLARAVGPAHRVRVVHNGVEIPVAPTIDPRMENLRHAGPVVCTLTQLRPGKGLETLLDSVPEVLAGCPTAQFAIWGDGPELGALGERARSLGIATCVHFLGSTSDSASVLQGADVFVLPSWAEAFPYVILEAMASARAIVATDVGGIGEALGADAAGLLVPAGAAAPLAQALLELLGDRRRAEQLAGAALRAVQERFTTQRMVAGVAEIYAQRSGGSSPGR
ncbi:MAG: glycosyltransferase family 4 protein [Solirubrobacteraceae bacterium]